MNIIKSLIVCSLLIAWTPYPENAVILPDNIYTEIDWTIKERKQKIAIRPIKQGKYSSAYIIRIQGREKPHYHDTHDLSVTLMSGKSILHFKQHEVVLNPGDVVNIPQGVLHWAENIGPSASEVYAVFSPRYFGKDKRLAK